MNNTTIEMDKWYTWSDYNDQNPHNTHYRGGPKQAPPKYIGEDWLVEVIYKDSPREIIRADSRCWNQYLPDFDDYNPTIVGFRVLSKNSYR